MRGGEVRRTVLLIVVALVAISGTQTFCARQPAEAPEADVPVKVEFAVAEGPSYARDIQPIFNKYCVRCHGENRGENGLRLDSYEHLISGTRFGPVVIPYRPRFSTLLYVLEGRTSERIAMPYKEHQISLNRVKNIDYWIAAGAQKN